MGKNIIAQVSDNEGYVYKVPQDLLDQFKVVGDEGKWERRRYGDKPLDFGEAGHINWIQRSLRALPRGWRLLDAGAGPQRYKKFADHLRYVSQDFCEYKGSGADQGIHPGGWDTSKTDIICDINGIPEPDASFDAVLCVSVLEHLPDPVNALQELARLIRPEGKILITAPFAGVTHFAPHHYYTGFPRYFYEKHLQEHFVIDDIRANGSLFEFLNTYLHYILSFSSRYTSEVANEYEDIAIDVVTRMLERFAQHSHDSEEVLNFGYQVTATRR